MMADAKRSGWRRRRRRRRLLVGWRHLKPTVHFRTEIMFYI